MTFLEQRNQILNAVKEKVQEGYSLYYSMTPYIYGKDLPSRLAVIAISKWLPLEAWQEVNKEDSVMAIEFALDSNYR